MMEEQSKFKERILSKLGITQLNTMQLAMHDAVAKNDEVVLLSPTGTGKTVAFLLPILQSLDPNLEEVQSLIIVPSRELAIQIEQVIRNMGSGFKVNAVYGGRSGNKDKIDIKTRPAILIGTPGRIADHLRNENFDTEFITSLVLDEFDKSLEIGFETEMMEILDLLPNIKKRILTSATQKVQIPEFVGLSNPKMVDFKNEKIQKLEIKLIHGSADDRLSDLLHLLEHIGDEPGIIFCNFKDSIADVDQFLSVQGISHGCFHGGMEQIDRERSLVKFRNGSHRILLATDLAARGLDIPELKFIIHFELPPRGHEFTHRNGRTARMNSEGTAYVMVSNKQRIPVFLEEMDLESHEINSLDRQGKLTNPNWSTLYITGGRRDKISKGDIAGLFFKIGKLKSDELGVIELSQDFSFVAVPTTKVEAVLTLVNNQRLKKKKVRVSGI